MLKLILTVILSLQLLLQAECLYSGEICYVEGQCGSCVPLPACEPIMEEIRRAGNPIPYFMRQKLQSLTCGYEMREPMVCCIGIHGITVPYTTLYPNPGGDTINFVGSGEQTGEQPGERPGDNDTVEPYTRRTPANRNGPNDIDGHPNLGLLPDNCGIMDSNRIVGGNRTGLLEMPWMVMLSYESSRGPKLSCGGTIINQWYILTAAHCVSFLTRRRLENIILGEHDVRQDPDCEISDNQEYCAPSIINATIDSVIAHPGYTPQTRVDDIALIRLSQPADFSKDNLKPICLPKTRELQDQALVGLNGEVAGWGVTEDGLQSPVLLNVALPIIAPKDCQNKYYNGLLQINETQICAGGEKDKDSCSGDSGGPLMYPGVYGDLGVRYVQRGIVSYGSKRCGIGGYPGIYTNVAYYMDWILDNIRS